MSEKPSDSTRRKVLKLVGATGLTAAGAGAVSGSAAAAPGGTGSITQESESLTQDISTNVVDSETGQRVGRFTGTLSLTEFGLNDAGEITTTGSLDGTLKQAGGATEQVSQSFEDVTTSLSSNGGCTILDLDLGPLDLELLGLNVNLNQIKLDITGETGEGNLLGNLLCAVADLGSGSGLLGLSTIVQDLLDVVNDLLGSLST